jgi:hypothetical protein
VEDHFPNTPFGRTNFPHEYSNSCDDPEAMLILPSGTPAFSTKLFYGPSQHFVLGLLFKRHKPIPCISMQNGGCSVSHCRSALGLRWEIPDLLVSARKCYDMVGWGQIFCP